MKHFFVFISLVLVYLISENVFCMPLDDNVRVASIHSRITATPSDRRNRPVAHENKSVPTIDRTIETLHRSRTVRESVEQYPKHHLLQPIELPLIEVEPKEDLHSTIAPFTDNHHAWKETQVIIPQNAILKY